MFDNTKRGKWLKSLKPGDKVCYNHRMGGWHIVKVKRITPTGRITLENNIKCDNTGYYCVRGVFWGSFFIEPITDEVRESILRQKLLSRLRCEVNWKDYTTKQLKVIYKNLTRMKEKNNDVPTS